MEAAADQKQQQLISDEWSTEVEKLLTATQKAPAGRASTRLPKAMMNAKAEAYTPQLLSLGPYHHRTLKDESVGPYHHRFTHLSQMENYKINGARDTANSNPNLIKEFFQKICEPGMLSRLEEFYDWKVDAVKDAQKFVWMMTVDALFLYYFLKSGFNGDAEESSGIVPAMASVRCDIVKLENQIPFFLLQEVEKSLKTNEIERLLLSRLASLSSFQDCHGLPVKVEKERHLLGCIHKYVSSFLEIEKEQAGGTRPTLCQKIRTALGDMIAAVCGIFFRHPTLSGRQDFLNKYNAEDLAKAGFSFKSFQGPGKIRFDRYSDTLFLPRIIISDPYTELILRNLLALEFNDPSPQKHVTEYVELMDCLIDTPEDVALLRDCHVIVRQSMMISDKYVATMWNGMCKPFFSVGLLEPPLGLKSQIKEVLIKNYYKSKIKSMFREFRAQYLAKPWQVVALLVGIIVVVMDTMQTYCSFKECKSKAGTKDNGTVGGRKHLGTFG